MAKFKTLLLGTAVGVVILALLVHWIGRDTLSTYRADLLFYLQAHLYLVAVSMVLALLVGIPAGVLLSRPRFARSAERFMQVFNIGNGEEITIRALAEKIRAMTASNSPIETIPYDVAYEAGFEDMPRRVPDIGKIRALVGYEPQVGLHDMLIEIIGDAERAAARRLPAGRAAHAGARASLGA